MILSLLACAGMMLVGGVQGFGQLQCSTDLKFSGTPKGGSNFTPPNTKICFMADNNRHMSLDVVEGEGCEVVVHAGDFDYWDDAELWMKQVWDVLPEDFPVYISIGNHDVIDYSGPTGYQQLMYNQLVRSGLDMECSGEVGINQICSYKGILLLGTAVGTCSYSAPSHIDYINSAFRTYGSNWKFCFHHKNQRLYQVGGKNDETGYAVLDACRQHGAVVVTGHEHSYARSKEISNFQNFTYDPQGFNPTIRRGNGLNEATSMLFVNGLGGESIREYEDDLEKNGWWASSGSIWECKGFCETSGMSGAPNVPILDGVVVCTFNNEGRENEAFCYFKDVSGRVFDEWYMYTEVGNAPSDFDADLSCADPFLEFPVSNCLNDVELSLSSPMSKEDMFARKSRLEDISGNVLLSDNTIIKFSKNSVAAFTVDNITVSNGDVVKGAWLQVFSASKGKKWKSKPANVVVKAMHKGVVANNIISWTKEPEDWEKHTVWNSEDISLIITEVISKKNFSIGDSITFIIESSDDMERSFYSLERGNWYAPTLAVELQNKCGESLNNAILN